jgi:glycosyltransferase involved in cell wall biosynthesis
MQFFRCTVAIPTFNRQDMIRRTLDSALDQDLEGLEVLVVDDHSTDRVFEIAESYSDRRVRVVRNAANIGLFANFNRCIELARSPLVRILCNDDRLTKNSLTREVELMEANENVALVVSRGLRVSVEGATLGVVGNHIPPGVYAGQEATNTILWFFAHYGINPITLPSGVLMRKSACMLAGGFDQTMRMNGDIDCFLRILQRGDLALLEDVGCLISVHPDQVSSALNGDKGIFEENFTLVKRHENALRVEGTFERVGDQFSAVAFCVGLRLWFANRREEARAHVAVALRHCSNRFRLAGAIIRCVLLRVMLDRFGIRTIPKMKQLTG